MHIQTPDSRLLAGDGQCLESVSRGEHAPVCYISCTGWLYLALDLPFVPNAMVLDTDAVSIAGLLHSRSMELDSDSMDKDFIRV